MVGLVRIRRFAALEGATNSYQPAPVRSDRTERRGIDRHRSAGNVDAAADAIAAIRRVMS